MEMLCRGVGGVGGSSGLSAGAAMTAKVQRREG